MSQSLSKSNVSDSGGFRFQKTNEFNKAVTERVPGKKRIQVLADSDGKQTDNPNSSKTKLSTKEKEKRFAAAAKMALYYDTQDIQDALVRSQWDVSKSIRYLRKHSTPKELTSQMLQVTTERVYREKRIQDIADSDGKETHSPKSSKTELSPTEREQRFAEAAKIALHYDTKDIQDALVQSEWDVPKSIRYLRKHSTPKQLTSQIPRTTTDIPEQSVIKNEPNEFIEPKDIEDALVRSQWDVPESIQYLKKHSTPNETISEIPRTTTGTPEESGIKNEPNEFIDTMDIEDALVRSQWDDPESIQYLKKHSTPKQLISEIHQTTTATPEQSGIKNEPNEFIDTMDTENATVRSQWESQSIQRAYSFYTVSIKDLKEHPKPKRLISQRPGTTTGTQEPNGSSCIYKPPALPQSVSCDEKKNAKNERFRLQKTNEFNKTVTERVPGKKRIQVLADREREETDNPKRIKTELSVLEKEQRFAAVAQVSLQYDPMDIQDALVRSQWNVSESVEYLKKHSSPKELITRKPPATRATAMAKVRAAFSTFQKQLV